MNWSEDACTRFQQLLQTNDRLRLFFEYMIGPSGYPSDTFLGEITNSVYPVGFICMIGMSSPPGDKWLVCNGGSYLRADYPDLFTALSTTHGSADALHFNVPDIRERSVIGTSASYALASTTGAATITLVENQIPAHTHNAAFKIPIHPAGEPPVVGGFEPGSRNPDSATGWTNDLSTYPAPALLDPTMAITIKPNVLPGGSQIPINNYHPVIAMPYVIRAKR